MLYDSFKVSPRGPAAGNTCASMRNLRILDPQTPSNWSLLGSIFENFPEASRWMFCHPFDVFWYPEGPGTFPEWSWTDLGTIIFWPKFLKNLTPYVDLGSCFHRPRIHRIGMSDLKSTSKKLIAHWKKISQLKRIHRFWDFLILGVRIIQKVQILWS